MCRQKNKDWLFKSTAAELNGSLEIIDEYKNSKTRVTVKCKKCGVIYSEIPKMVLEGRLHFTSDHARWNRTYIHSDSERKKIVEQLQQIARDNIKNDLLDYSPETKTVTFRCHSCGKVSTVDINRMCKNPNYCPDCEKKMDKKIENCKRAIQIVNLLERSPSITLISKERATLVCECKECEDLFTVTGYTKKRKITCPNCYKRMRSRKRAEKRAEERKKRL